MFVLLSRFIGMSLIMGAAILALNGSDFNTIAPMSIIGLLLLVRADLADIKAKMK